MAELPNYRAVLFDLDGTLTDPLEGIGRSMNYALEQLGYPPLDEAAQRRLIGPPLRASFAALLGEELADRAVQLYRERYTPLGAYENRVFAGIPELLAELHAAGLRLFLATSKLQSTAEQVLAHFALAPYFTSINGTTADLRIADKTAVIASILPQLSAEERACSVMVGDREHDVFGAMAHNLPCIGVSWGYGSVEELETAGAIQVAGAVAELKHLLWNGAGRQ